MQVEEQAPPLTSDDMTPEDASMIFTLMNEDLALIDMKFKLAIYGPLAKGQVDQQLEWINGEVNR